MKWNIRELKAQSRSLLARNRTGAEKLVLYYVLILLGAQLLNVTLGQYLVNQADTFTGLSGEHTKSMLMTGKTLLDCLVIVLSLLLPAGYQAGLLSLARGDAPNPGVLSLGFQRPARYLVCFLLLILRMVGLTYLLLLGFSLILAPFFPLPPEVTLEGIYANDPTVMALAGEALGPFLIVLGVAAAILAIFLFYRYRLLFLVAADWPDLRSGQILRVSSELTRGFRLQFLRLDLSFWWYGLLMLVIEALPYLDLILARFGIVLPLPAAAVETILMVGYLLIWGGVTLLFNNRVQAPYAMAYDGIMRYREDVAKQLAPVDENR